MPKKIKKKVLLIYLVFPADITNELKKDFLKIGKKKVASLKWLKPEFQAVNQF